MHDLICANVLAYYFAALRIAIDVYCNNMKCV